MCVGCADANIRHTTSETHVSPRCTRPLLSPRPAFGSSEMGYLTFKMAKFADSGQVGRYNTDTHKNVRPYTSKKTGAREAHTNRERASSEGEHAVIKEVFQSQSLVGLLESCCLSAGMRINTDKCDAEAALCTAATLTNTHTHTNTESAAHCDTESRLNQHSPSLLHPSISRLFLARSYLSHISSLWDAFTLNVPQS